MDRCEICNTEVAYLDSLTGEYLKFETDDTSRCCLYRHKDWHKIVIAQVSKIKDEMEQLERKKNDVKYLAKTLAMNLSRPKISCGGRVEKRSNRIQPDIW